MRSRQEFCTQEGCFRIDARSYKKSHMLWRSQDAWSWRAPELFCLDFPDSSPRSAIMIARGSTTKAYQQATEKPSKIDKKLCSQNLPKSSLPGTSCQNLLPELPNCPKLTKTYQNLPKANQHHPTPYQNLPKIHQIFLLLLLLSSSSCRNFLPETPNLPYYTTAVTVPLNNLNRCLVE